MSDYTPSDKRYEKADDWFRYAGGSGLVTSKISLGFYQNFGAPGTDSLNSPDEASMHANCREMVLTAFDHGITHFDLADVYGPPHGAAESRFGKILREDLSAYRDEIVIATKAGAGKRPGPNGSKKNRKDLLPRLDKSLRRLRLDYVDIFYVHGPHDHTPLEETLSALDQAVRSGKALYAGVCSFSGDMTAEMMRICERESFVKPRIHQPGYNMRYRWIEKDLLAVTNREGMGVAVFGVVGGGTFTDKYLDGVPADSRMGKLNEDARAHRLTNDRIQVSRALNEIAKQRGEKLAHMAAAWTLRDTRIHSAILGASRPEQIVDIMKAADAAPFTEEELLSIERAVEPIREN